MIVALQNSLGTLARCKTSKMCVHFEIGLGACETRLYILSVSKVGCEKADSRDHFGHTLPEDGRTLLKCVDAMDGRGR